MLFPWRTNTTPAEHVSALHLQNLTACFNDEVTVQTRHYPLKNSGTYDESAVHRCDRRPLKVGPPPMRVGAQILDFFAFTGL